MTFAFPQFTESTTLDARRSWTAAFDSYDQRHDDAYYLVTVHEGAEFVVQVPLYWAGDDWTGPDFVERLRRELHAVAATGETNTTYTGYPGRP